MAYGVRSRGTSNRIGYWSIVVGHCGDGNGVLRKIIDEVMGASLLSNACKMIKNRCVEAPCLEAPHCPHWRQCMAQPLPIGQDNNTLEGFGHWKGNGYLIAIALLGHYIMVFTMVRGV